MYLSQKKLPQFHIILNLNTVIEHGSKLNNKINNKTRMPKKSKLPV